MPTRTIVLTEEQCALVDDILTMGFHPDVGAMLDDALNDLRRRMPEMIDLKARLDRGVAALEAADLSEVEEADLDRFLDGWSRLA